MLILPASGEPSANDPVSEKKVTAPGTDISISVFLRSDLLPPITAT